MMDYGNWLSERHKAGLPTDVPTPPDVEPYEVWFRRIRGLDPYTGESVLLSEERARLFGAAPVRPPSQGVAVSPLRRLLRGLIR